MYQPWQLWTLLGLLLLALAAEGLVVFRLGQEHADAGIRDLRQERAQLRSELAALEDETQRLREQVVVLERSSQIDRQASVEVRQELASLQQELLSQREELEFYRGIMAPGEAKPGLRVQRFELEPGAEPGRFRYDLMLIQVKRNDRYVKGVVQLYVDGSQEGAEKSLSLAEITEPSTAKLPFRFRYFQHFEGALQLPANFRAEKVRLEVVPSGKYGPPRLDEEFEWPA